MALISPVIARLKAQVPGLRSVDGIQAFSHLMRDGGGLPQSTPAAHVLPVATTGGAVQSGAGAFVQSITETVGVIVTLRPNDQAGAAGVDPLEALKMEIITALAGWAPGDEVGDFAFASAKTLSFGGGAIVYQIDFTIQDQLRIYG